VTWRTAIFARLCGVRIMEVPPSSLVIMEVSGMQPSIEQVEQLRHALTRVQPYCDLLLLPRDRLSLWGTVTRAEGNEKAVKR